MALGSSANFCSGREAPWRVLCLPRHPRDTFPCFSRLQVSGLREPVSPMISWVTSVGLDVSSVPVHQDIQLPLAGGAFSAQDAGRTHNCEAVCAGELAHVGARANDRASEAGRWLRTVGELSFFHP